MAASGADCEADEEEGAERQPLLPKNPGAALLGRIHDLHGETIVDTMTYKVDTLSGWSIFMLQGVRTAFSSSAWWMFLKLCGVSILVAALILAFVPDPAQLKTSKFHAIGVFLRIFVGLLGGFFLSSSVNRWFQCADGFMQIEDSIRNLQMQFLALGVRRDLKYKCVRYGVVSDHILARTLEIEAITNVGERLAATECMWAELIEGEGDQEPMIQDDAEVQRFLALSRIEADELKKCRDPAAMVWVWVASLVGRMSQDGWIPPMGSPTYGRVMNLVQAAHGGIRTVKLAVMVQAPFIYVHMLAVLVHVNNIFNAIAFGAILGSTVGAALQRRGNIVEYSHRAKESEIIADVENLVISFVVNLIGAFVYQVLLEVGLALAQPFSRVEGNIPTGRLLDDLQRDLNDGMNMAIPPSWEAPFLKPPAAQPAIIRIPMARAA